MLLTDLALTLRARECRPRTDYGRATLLRFWADSLSRTGKAEVARQIADLP
jgi:hypothetical protein